MFVFSSGATRVFRYLFLQLGDWDSSEWIRTANLRYEKRVRKPSHLSHENDQGRTLCAHITQRTCLLFFRSVMICLIKSSLMTCDTTACEESMTFIYFFFFPKASFHTAGETNKEVCKIIEITYIFLPASNLAVINPVFFHKEDHDRYKRS